MTSSGFWPDLLKPLATNCGVQGCSFRQEFQLTPALRTPCSMLWSHHFRQHWSIHPMITPRGTKTKDHNQDKPIWDAILHNQAHVFFEKKVYPPRELIYEYQSPPKGNFQNVGYVGSLEGTTNNESVSSNYQAKKKKTKKKQRTSQKNLPSTPPQKKTSITKRGNTFLF